MFRKCNAAFEFSFCKSYYKPFFFCCQLTQTFYLKSIAFLAQFIDCCALRFKAEISFPAHFQ